MDAVNSEQQNVRLQLTSTIKLNIFKLIKLAEIHGFRRQM